MNVKERFQELPIRLKLLFGYLLTFLIIIIAGNSLLYIYVRSTIESNIESELSNTTSSILNMVESTIDASIANYLRAIAEKNLEIVSDLHSRQLKGELTINEAKGIAARILRSQTIGKTGYIYCVGTNGVIQVHFNQSLIGENLSKFDFIAEQKRRRIGYLEYDWANPGENNTRPKALYMTYFGPWDWIISASSYRDEFNSLINVSDLRESILSIQFGETGYSYVMDSKGNLLIHPKLEGTNIFKSIDSNGHKFIQEMCRKKNGSIIYPWQNPGELKPRPKLVFFNYIEELDWIVASSSYLEEFFKPLTTVTVLTVLSVFLMIGLSLPLTWLISSSITKPLEELIAGLSSVAQGDFSKRIRSSRRDELGKVASYFNATMHQLEDSNSKLHNSEKNYRSIFENSIEGVFQCDALGTISVANPSFAAMIGFGSTRKLLKENVNFHVDLIANHTHRELLSHKLRHENSVRSFELQLKHQSGTIFWCMINARSVFDEESGEILMLEGFLTDINDLKQAQEAQRAIQEELENRVEERTTELSKWIVQLERQDAQSKLVHEMADMLQTCSTVHETFPIVDKYLHSFFPDANCSLFLFDDSESVFDQCIPLVLDNSPPISMHIDECWALRQGKSFQFTPENGKLTCDHVIKDTGGYLCIPLIAHGTTSGLLHLDSNVSAGGDHSNNEAPISRWLPLGIRLTEHIALALANLKLREELVQLSLKDSLTGLSNRRHLESILQKMLFLHNRHNVEFSLLMIDVDHFKTFNDTYGHEIGDQVLKEIGKNMLAHTRGEDLCSRFGGEEFISVLAATNLDQAAKRAERLLHDISENVTVSHQGEKLRVTVSIGVATCPDHGHTIDKLIKAADSALYSAKRNGRNRFEKAT